MEMNFCQSSSRPLLLPVPAVPGRPSPCLRVPSVFWRRVGPLCPGVLDHWPLLLAGSHGQ